MEAVRVKIDQRPALFLGSGLVMAMLLILIWGIMLPPNHAYDDAYITYRYADNFRNGLGLVYNPGEWVLGTTTPLFALLLGVLGFIFADIEWLGHWVGMMSWMVAAVAAAGLFWQAKRPFTALIATFFVALQPIMLSVIGMETTFVVALMLASAWSWFADRRVLAAILFAALFMTRADGVLWAVVIGLEVWRRNGRLPWRVTLLTILLAIPWFAYAQWRYGSFLSNSVAAKSGQTGLMAVGGQDSFLSGFINTWTWMPTVAIIFFTALILAGLWVIFKDAPSFWYLPAWLILYFVAYTLLGVANFSWYFVPPVIIVTLIAAMGIGALFGDGKAFVFSHRWRFVIAGFALIVSFILAGIWLNQMSVLQMQKGYRASYPKVGDWLAENTAKDARAATIEIGMIGYASQRPILDTMGLISPEMTNRQVGWTETVVYAVSQLWPEYAVTLENTAWDWVVNQWWFDAYYSPQTTFSDATIYKRESVPIAAYQVTSLEEYTTGFRLVGADFNAQQIQPNETLEVWLNMEVDQDQVYDYQLTTYLIDTQTDARTAVTTVAPLNGGYPSSVWQADDQLALPNRLQIPADLSPGTYRLGLFIYNPASGEGLPTTTTPAEAYPEVELGWLRYGYPDDESHGGSMAWQTVEEVWQDSIHLEAIAFPSEIGAGGVLSVDLRWFTEHTPMRDLTVFVHIIDESGEIVAQKDERPFAGRFPTASWQVGERLRDQIEIQLPANATASEYGLRVGLYDENGRLPLRNGSGDYLELPNLIKMNH